MSSDLELIRSESAIDATRIGNLLFDPGFREARAGIAHILSQEPLMDKSLRPHLNHTQLLQLSLRIFKRLLVLRDVHSWDDREFTLACRLQDDLLPTAFHRVGFIPVIASNGTAEQQAAWLPRCRRYEVVGCYAQTELAHGSNVRGLETVARFDVTSGEFVVSSPRLESTKWWVGGLGVVANHAIVQAALYLPTSDDPLEYKSYGPHLFIVPIRSTTTHEPLPGIIVGDIGPKAYGGLGTVDNGFVHFKDVRIPLENMLMRHAQVTPRGEYLPAVHDKLSYGSMVALRAGMPAELGWSLARAVTIAIRYCIQRRQFPAVEGGPERRVITYSSVKHRLFPLLASAYANINAGRELWAQYTKMLEDVVQRGSVETLAEVHSLSVAIKVKSSMDCASGIEEARKAMGGHGYSHMSGVGQLFAHYAPSETYEGDNYVIAQQTARALLKHVKALRTQGSGHQHHLPASSAYLLTTLVPPSRFSAQRSGVHTANDWFLPTHQLPALEHRAAFLVLDLNAHLTSSSSSTTPATPDLGSHSWTCSRVARAHADVFMVSAFNRLASSPTLPPDSANALTLLSSIFALTTLTNALPDLFETGYITPQQSRLLRQALDEAVCSRLTVADALRLTDAFAFTGFEMGASVLGVENGHEEGEEGDGGVYVRMWEEVMKDKGGINGDGFRAECLEIVHHHHQGSSRGRGEKVRGSKL